MKSLLSLICLLGLLAASLVSLGAAETNAIPPEKGENPEPQLANKINSVECEFQRSAPAQFLVTASTTVPTGGYKAELRRATYIKQPEDGIQDYHLYLTKPEGFVTQVISEVKASDGWQTERENLAWLKGVRVHGVGDGVVVKMIDKK